MMNRPLVELRLIGAMMLDDPLNDDLHAIIDPEDFHEPLLRRAWEKIAELKKSMGEVNLSLVCGQIERDGVDYSDTEGVRRLFEYSTSLQFVGTGCEAKSDWNTLAQDRGNVLSIEGITFIAVGG